jgi:predicted acyltransferase (DUF342 family)
MATIAVLANDIQVDNRIYAWSPLAAGDDGAPVGSTGTGDRTVQVLGTFGAGGTVVIEGSLNGSDWSVLRDPTGALLSFSSAGLKAVMENVVSLRPRVTAGDGSTLITALMAVRRNANG